MEVDRYLDEISERLRAWRREAGMTLQQVATRSGVAASTIQKVESQQMVPTIAVLFKIARGLDRSPAEMIDDRANPEQVAFRSRNEAQIAETPAGSVLARLTGDLADARLSTWRVLQQPQEAGRVVDLGTKGEALILCERGELEVQIGQQAHKLMPGDSVHFKTCAGLSWRALGSAPSEFVLIGSDTPGLSRALDAAPRRSA